MATQHSSKLVLGHAGGSRLAVDAKLAPNPLPAFSSSGKMGPGQMMAQRTRMIWIKMWIYLKMKKMGAHGMEMMMTMMMRHGG